MMVEKQGGPNSSGDDGVGASRQFWLMNLMVLTLGIGAGLGLLRWMSLTEDDLLFLGALLVIPGVIGACLYWFTGRIPWFLVFTMLLVVGSVYFMRPRYQHTRVSRRSICSNNLKQIATALQGYHGSFGSYPPAYIADETGRPIHSWRVLILPYMDGQPLYDRYDFDEPWDGPNNSKLHDEVMQLYRCPLDQPDVATETSYVAVVGKHTMWPSAGTTSNKDISDGLTNTIMLVEVSQSGIHWMQPRDLHINSMPMQVNAPRGCGCGSQHLGGINVAFADSSTRFLDDTTTPSALRRLLECDDGAITMNTEDD